MECPAIAQIEPAHHPLDKCGGKLRAVVVDAHEHLWRGAVRLDVVRLVPEPLQPYQVLHRQPDHSGDRVPADHPEDDDLLSDTHAVASSCPETSDTATLRVRCLACTSCIWR